MATVNQIVEPSPKTRPRRRSGIPEIEKDSLEWRQQFVADNECWTSAEVATQSSSTAKNRAALASRWSAEGKIFAIQFHRKTLFPKFQFKDGSPIPAISEVIAAFPEHATGWDIAFFFTVPNSLLGGVKPVALLNRDPKKLVSLAGAFVHPADAF